MEFDAATSQMTNNQLTNHSKILIARASMNPTDTTIAELVAITSTLSARLDHAQRMVDEMAGELDAYDRMIEVA